MTPARQTIVAGTLLALTLLAGSAALPAAPGVAPPPTPAGPVAPVRLVSFDSCADALAELRAATAAHVRPWGFADDETTQPARRAIEDMPQAAGAPQDTAAAPQHSTTNVHERGVDEPDLVKTDGRRIVTVTGGVLRVADPATRRITGRLDLARDHADLRWAQHDLLLHGDHALVLTDVVTLPRPRTPVATDRLPAVAPAGTRLVLVDLAGAPRVLGTYQVQGRTVDARQTGATARVVVRSGARVTFPDLPGADEAARTTANMAAVAAAGIDAWLPAYEWTAGPERRAGRVGCDRLSRPATGTGSSVLTVLSFDLTADRLADGDPVSVAADADTVYGTGTALYLAGQRIAHGARPARPGLRPTGGPVTDIYQFDTGVTGRPRYVAAGSVPGWLVNQYALSEWAGHLRAATTTGVDERTSESGVHVLRREGNALVPVGTVTGLGRGERIWSVRYLGGTAYVVTFRQTDPLYALDLTDHATPRVTGELKITGYSAYLHPIAEGRLLGVGQEADRRGRVQGVQVSLFDVRDPAGPTRLDRWHLPGAWSSAEHDPHAFLHDPETGLVAVPVDEGVRLLRVSAEKITELGRVTHPSHAVSRSLLVDGVLWTVSEAGLQANDPVTTRSLAWLPSA
ncbi:beta-propeller domain-containing protein [Micromonospora sp. WMMA1363]|uniref:beta-propeller domain-containing protein n=1 Tax=Micromonospora sp. WMMA1363 TaxID=3053985 RepID=UPI00259CE8AE|nr:beta-propeller domain-containing protein [Micromonospora sp. WMMA1363]MDM4721760.1 beta-propeller domain-containing protein [Micromonospora sp. WMMA1363]